jgi:protein phosphatase
MASTLAGVLLDGDHFTAFNVGDSRVYRFRRAVLSQISQDHSVIARMVRDGEVSAKNAKNAATMYRGLESSLIADFEATEFDIWIDRFTLEEGDAILLCTDGVTEEIDDEGLTEILLANESDPASAVQAIYERVMESGAEDNFSIVLSLRQPSAMEKRTERER